jgi:hypothetical protein
MCKSNSNSEILNLWHVIPAQAGIHFDLALLLQCARAAATAKARTLGMSFHCKLESILILRSFFKVQEQEQRQNGSQLSLG